MLSTMAQRWLNVLRDVVATVGNGPLRINREELGRAYQLGRERLGVTTTTLVLAEAEVELAGCVTFTPMAVQG